MVKLLLTGLWVCAVTLGSVYMSIQAAATNGTETDPSDFMGGLDYVRADVISVPVVGNGKVEGYFLARLVFTAEPEKLAQLSVEPQALITDELYSHLSGNEKIRFTQLERFDVDGFRTGVRESLNARVGEKVFHDIIVEQIDYLSKDEIRSNMTRGLPPAASVMPDGGGNGGDAEKGGHS